MVVDRITEFVKMLETLEIPIAYFSFKKGPGLPFLTYEIAGRDDLIAENYNYHKIINVRVELYTDKPFTDVEQKLETLLEENELEYSWSQFFVESEKVWQTIYEMRLL